MHGVDIRCAVGLGIVPDQKHAGLGLDLHANFSEVRFAAFFDFIKERHCRPATLTAALTLKLPILFSRIKPVIVRLELLTRQIALALDRFTADGIHAQEIVDPSRYAHDKGIVSIKIARVRRAKAA